MAFATLVSRLTGFARIVLLATILGAALSSAFSVAYQLPNLIAALVLEATFTAIFVPVLARAERDDPDGGAGFVRRLVTLGDHAAADHHAMLSVASAPLLVGLMLGGDPAGEPRTHDRVRLPAAAPGVLLRLVVGVHGDPQHPQRVRAARVGTGVQQPGGHRHAWPSMCLSRASFRSIRCGWAIPSCSCSVSA